MSGIMKCFRFDGTIYRGLCSLYRLSSVSPRSLFHIYDFNTRLFYSINYRRRTPVESPRRTV